MHSFRLPECLEDLTAQDVLDLLDCPFGVDAENVITLLLIDPDFLWYWRGEQAGEHYNSLRRARPRPEPPTPVGSAISETWGSDWHD